MKRAQVQVQVYLFTLIQLQYNSNNEKKEVKKELIIHRIKHNKGKQCVAAKGAKFFELAITTERF